MMGKLRPLAVALWRWVTGPVSILALLLVGAYVLLVAVGPPLLGLWLGARALLAVRAATAEATGVGAMTSEYLRLAVQITVLAAGWYLARRYLPPFRWRY